MFMSPMCDLLGTAPRLNALKIRRDIPPHFLGSIKYSTPESTMVQGPTSCEEVSHVRIQMESQGIIVPGHKVLTLLEC